MRHYLPRFWLCALFLGGSLSFLGCHGCHRRSPVPFKRGETSATKENESAAASAPSGVAQPFQPSVGSVYPEGTSEIDLGGAVIKAPQGWIGASLSVDLDQDRDLDALLVVMERDAPTVLRYTERLQEGFNEPQDVGILVPARAGCQVGAAEIRALTPGIASISIRLSCSAQAEQPVSANGVKPSTPLPNSAVQPPPPPSQPPAPVAQDKSAANLPSAPPPTGEQTSTALFSEQHLWAVALERPPRVIEHFALLPPSDDRREETLSVGLSSQDFDKDGYADLSIAITDKSGGIDAAATIDIHWLNRPGGLARDPAQPEKALADLGNRARKLLNRNAEQALASAQQALAFHRALCRESGAVRFTIGQSEGIACGPSAGAGKAAAVKAAALAKGGQLFAALEAYSALDNPAFRLSQADRSLARDALYSLAAVSEAVWQEGPPHHLPSDRAVRLSALAFVDENSLLLRGSAPLRYDLTARSYLPVEAAQGNTVIRDPSERFAIAGIYRGCDGYKLRIIDSARAASAKPEDQKVVSEPLIEAHPAPLGSGCPEQTGVIRVEDGGFRVMGWSVRGVVLIKALRVWLLPLDTEARATSELVAVAPEGPLPGPIAAGAVAPGGGAYALLTPAGIVLRTTASSPKQQVFRPPQWDFARATDVAVSPSGKKLALLSAGRVYIATLPSAN
jgi:hypothetical protein